LTWNFWAKMFIEVDFQASITKQLKEFVQGLGDTKRYTESTRLKILL